VRPRILSSLNPYFFGYPRLAAIERKSEEAQAGRKEFHMSNTSFFDMARDRFRTGLEDVDRKWGWYFALGIFLVILGVMATGMAVATTILSVVVMGWILLGAGAGLIVLSFLSGRWGGFLVTLAAGALSAIAGIMMLASPLSGAAAITLMVGAILVAAGIYRSGAAVAMRYPGWGWSLLSGMASLILGTLLVSNWQINSLWFLGVYIGIDLIFHGFSWIMFSLGVHRLAKMARTRDTTEAYRRAA
jgi:uncharacterized membrane protein HdeD (DUF308 family)